MMSNAITIDAQVEREGSSLADLRRQCVAMARRRAGLSALASFVPLPGIDLITDVAVLMALLADISHRFGLTEAQIEALSPSRKALAYKLTTAAGGFLATRMATSRIFMTVLQRAGFRLGIMEATRFAPIIGQAIAAAIAYFTLTRIARRHIEECAEIAGKLSG
jgi:hypothetical protein